MKSLPDKPSALLELALADLEATEKDPRYTINMDRWHAPYQGTCFVCLAGSVIAKTLQAPRDEYFAPYYFDADVAVKLEALNALREGDVDEALVFLDITDPVHVPDRKVTTYEDDSGFFKQDMRDLIKDLKEQGL